jgi:subtilase family serine protease
MPIFPTHSLSATASFEPANTIGASSNQILAGDDESTVPIAYADNTCNLFAQLGARGVSVTVAAGDSGVGTTVSNFNR